MFGRRNLIIFFWIEIKSKSKSNNRNENWQNVHVILNRLKLTLQKKILTLGEFQIHGSRFCIQHYDCNIILLTILKIDVQSIPWAIRRLYYFGHYSRHNWQWVYRMVPYSIQLAFREYCPLNAVTNSIVATADFNSFLWLIFLQ